jgi:hypothetical protein
MINNKNYNNINFFWQLLSIYIIARLVTYYFEIVPVGEEISLKWQLMDPNLLSKDLLRTVYYLHYQPPFWNLIYGIFIKLVGVDYNKIGIALHLFNIFFSFITIYYFYLITNFFKLSKTLIYILYFIFFIFSIAFLYYETYMHYTHLTVFLFAQFSYLYLKFSENHLLKYELLIYLTALFLAFTWSAFSLPFFMIVLLIGITLIKYKKNILRSIIICFIFTLLTLTLSVKNKIEVNMFANSTWIGMQLFTVLSYGDKWDYWEQCNFYYKDIDKDEASFKKNNPKFKNTHPSLVGNITKLNNVGFIYRSKKCLDLAINEIKKEPIDYLSRVKYLFISNHGHFTFDHVGWDPKEWRKYFGFFYDLNKNKYLSPIKVRSLQLYYLIMYAFFSLLTIKSILEINSDKNKINKSISAIFLIYVWLMLVIHIAAGYEQERMRHMGHFLHIIFFIILFKNKFNYKKIFQEYFKK